MGTTIIEKELFPLEKDLEDGSYLADGISQEFYYHLIMLFL